VRRDVILRRITDNEILFQELDQAVLIG